MCISKIKKINKKTGLVMFAKAQHGVGKAVIKLMHVVMKSVIYTTGGAADGSGGQGHEGLSGRSILLGGVGGLKNSVCVRRPDI